MKIVRLQMVSRPILSRMEPSLISRDLVLMLKITLFLQNPPRDLLDNLCLDAVEAVVGKGFARVAFGDAPIESEQLFSGRVGQFAHQVR